MESPVDQLVTGAAMRLDADSVRDAWTRALHDGAQAAGVDPEDDPREIEYKEADDLPALYKAVSGELGLAPGHYSEQAFKQILGRCHSVVVGLGSLRNKVGDAH